MDSVTNRRDPWTRELAWTALIAALGVLPRLALVLAYPTQPVSDFVQLIRFGQELHQESLVAHTWQWEFFNPGLPSALSVVFHLAPGPDEAAARLATAVLCGLLGVLPFLIWRGVLPFWVRLSTGLALALWPGQMAFSGVVAQDNWVLAPTVALGALAVRALCGGASSKGSPIAAGILFVLALVTRQEMLVTLFPVALAASGLWNGRVWQPRKLVPLAATAGVLLLAFAGQRFLATGRFTVLTQHTGTTVLSAYIPGATANYWADPVAYVASVRPDLVLNRTQLRKESLGLALDEALRRPGFHAYRIFSCVLKFAIEGESDNLYWALIDPEAQPPDRRAGAKALAEWLGPWLKVEMALLLALFLGALFLAVGRRNEITTAILVLSTFAILKGVLHSLTMAQGRYYLSVTAIGILIAGLGLLEARRAASKRLPLLAYGAAALIAAATLFVTPRVVAHVRALDRVDQPVYQFPLLTPDSAAELFCRVEKGRLHLLEANRVILHPFPFAPDPAPGEVSELACDLKLRKSRTPVPVTLLIQDGYARGGLPGRIVQRVEVEGGGSWSHDLAAEGWEGWSQVPLGEAWPGVTRKVRIQIAAVQPDPGAAWGTVAGTEIRVIRAQPAGAAEAGLRSR